MTILKSTSREKTLSSTINSEKRRYAKPLLTYYGSVVTLTAGAGGSGADIHAGCTGPGNIPCTD